MLTSGFTAEYGRAGDGIVQLTTRSRNQSAPRRHVFNFKRDIFDAYPGPPIRMLPTAPTKEVGHIF